MGENVEKWIGGKWYLIKRKDLREREGSGKEIWSRKRSIWKELWWVEEIGSEELR